MLDLPLTPKVSGFSFGGVEKSTPKKAGVVGVKFSNTKNSGVGVGRSDNGRENWHRRQNISFCVLKEKIANKVGFSIQKYFRHLKALVSALVSDFPIPLMLVSGVESDTDTETDNDTGVGVKTSLCTYIYTCISTAEADLLPGEANLPEFNGPDCM